MKNTITNPQALAFHTTFMRHRNINVDFYDLVPEDSFNFKLTPISDSVAESLIHLVDTTRDYYEAIMDAILVFNRQYDDLIRMKTGHFRKNDLIRLIKTSSLELENALRLSDIGERIVKVKWSEKPIKVLDMLWGLQNHEILHTGWNIAIMDALGIKRFPSLQQMWG